MDSWNDVAFPSMILFAPTLVVSWAFISMSILNENVLVLCFLLKAH